MHNSLPHPLYTAEQVRQLDHNAIHELGIDGFELMKRAARVTFQAIVRKWPDIKSGGESMEVFCGAGNNGGDGYLIARLATEAGINVRVFALKVPEKLTGDARKAYEYCKKSGVLIQNYSDGYFDSYSDSHSDSHPMKITGALVVDAMLGTGLSGPVKSPYQELIRLINASDCQVCSVDIPSGLSADTGVPFGISVKADLTISFIGLKQGLLTGAGPEYSGELVFDDLDVPDPLYDSVSPSCHHLLPENLSDLMKPRSKLAHKGDNGHVLLLGGNYGMPGAIIMAAEAAIHCGAGRVTIATRSEHLAAIAVRCPEIMAIGVETQAEFREHCKGKSVVVVGPGLGRDQWARSLLRESFNANCPMVIDADALTLLSEHPQLHRHQKFPMILTPHPGEMARLLNITVEDIQQDRFTAVKSCAGKFNAIAVLKGAGTLIHDGSDVSLCSAGNPGMAVAGMGDVLSGVLGAVLAQGLDAYAAARLAVWLHSSAADEVVSRQGEIGLRATELIPIIRQRLNTMVTGQS